MTEQSRRNLVKGLATLAAGACLPTACEDKPTPVPSQPKASGTPVVEPDREYKVGWSVWTGWMPFKLMDEKGFLAKRAQQHHVRVKLQHFSGYLDSVKAYSETRLDGVAMTSMESLQPVSSGVASVGILVNDISTGGDGLLVRNAPDIKSLRGKTILLEQYSVSHYLLARALESVGLKESDVTIKNVPGDQAGQQFLSNKAVEAAVTWNPFLFKATESGQGKVLFSSKDIPGEVIDFLIVSSGALQRSPGVGRALSDAWYDAMRYIQAPETRADAIKIMASGADVTPEEFEKMLAGTDLYTERSKCASFLTSDTLKETMGRIQKFSSAHNLIKDDRFKIGYGPGGWEKLRFDPSYVKGGG